MICNISLKCFCAWWIVSMSQVLTQSHDPVANIPQGRIVGIKVYTQSSLLPIEIFYGVPYATAPIGRYRFSAPERHAGWKRTFFAHRVPPRCPQRGDSDTDGNFSEDCLFLNIWTPQRVDGRILPVVVTLYSETWLLGGPNLPHEELAAEGVVVVQVSYRLHLLSFFSLGSIQARGNLALLDQYLALLWVRENIAAFGGDPNSITLLGHSAGADSILHHISSPRANGLYQRAIIMSPSDIWKTIKDPEMGVAEIRRISLQAARQLGCVGDADQDILQCMRVRSISDILSLYANETLSYGLQPVPDVFLPESEQYLPKSISTALSAANQPTMQLDILLGTTNLEAMNYNEGIYEKLQKHDAAYVSEYANSKVFPELLRLFAVHRPDAIPIINQAIRWEYWNLRYKGVQTETFEAIEVLYRVESSAKWGAGSALLAARLARRVTRLYVYRFSQPATIDLSGKSVNFTGAVHGADLVALLGDPLMLQLARRPTTAEEKRISRLFRSYITSFIKFGSPGVDEDWQRYKAGDAHIHDICLERNDIRSASRDVAFWLQYLPLLSNLKTSSEHTEQLSSEKGERLRGGVFAMVGVSVILLLLLFACLVLLRKERVRHSSISEDTHTQL